MNKDQLWHHYVIGFVNPLSWNVRLFHSSSSPGEELLARPKLQPRRSGEQRHQAHQRSWHPRGVPVRDHVRGAEFNHTGHPNRRAGDHRGGGESVYVSGRGTNVKPGHQKNGVHIPCFQHHDFVGIMNISHLGEALWKDTITSEDLRSVFVFGFSVGTCFMVPNFPFFPWSFFFFGNLILSWLVSVFVQFFC